MLLEARTKQRGPIMVHHGRFVGHHAYNDRGIACNARVGRDVAHDYSTGRDKRSLPDGHARQNRDARGDKRTVFDGDTCQDGRTAARVGRSDFVIGCDEHEMMSETTSSTDTNRCIEFDTRRAVEN